MQRQNNRVSFNDAVFAETSSEFLYKASKVPQWGYSFQQLYEDVEEGQILFKAYIAADVKVLIRKGGASLCAYAGVPCIDEYSEYRMPYEDAPIWGHGGLTYAGEMEEMWWYYGIDFAHLEDRTFFDLDPRFAEIRNQTLNGMNDKEWRMPQVAPEAYKLGVRLWKWVNGFNLYQRGDEPF